MAAILPSPILSHDVYTQKFRVGDNVFVRNMAASRKSGMMYASISLPVSYVIYDHLCLPIGGFVLGR